MRVLASLIICAIVGLASVQSPVPPTNAAAAAKEIRGAVCATANQDGKLDLKIETRKGEGVKLRAQQLRNKNKAVAKAMKAAEEKGLKPAFEAGISILAVKPIHNASFKQDGQTTIVDGDYELTFFPYDNGNDATWEGVIYFKKPFGETVFSTLLDVSTDEPLVIWEQRWQQDPNSTRLRDVAKHSRGRSTVTMTNSSAGHHAPATLMQDTQLKEFLSCFATGCRYCTAGCRLAGKYYWACTSACCGGVAIYCAIKYF